MDKIDQWHLSRWSKYTASEAFKLLVKGKGNEMFGEGAWTYIEQKALEMTTRMWERPELEEVKSLLYGKVHEYPAYAEYVHQTRNTSLTYLGDVDPLFYPHPILGDEFGGTPDCADITDQGTISFGVEIKCPKNPIYHFRRLKWKDQWNIKEEYSLVYTQIQSLLMITGAQEWHFVSYDDRQISRSHKIKIIPVLPDKNFQNNLEIRLRQAIREKYRIISEIYNIQVANRSEFRQKFQLAA
jgi:hypothetical protein